MPQVAPSFNVDAMGYWIGRFGSPSLGVVSQGEFSAIGVDRILDLLALHGVHGTIFISGHSALAFPDRVRAVHDAGHEVAHHGFVHERMSALSRSQQMSVMDKGMSILERLTGRQPLRYRSPSTSLTEATPGLLKSFGVAYDSSLLADDVHPYWLRDGDRYSTSEPYLFGDDLDIVELPWGWVMNDLPHVGCVPGGAAVIAPTSQVHEVWREEFDYFARHSAGACLQLVLHPGLIGRGPRIEMLGRTIDAMKARGARFTTLLDASRKARAVLEPPQSRLALPKSWRARHFERTST